MRISTVTSELYLDDDEILLVLKRGCKGQQSTLADPGRWGTAANPEGVVSIVPPKKHADIGAQAWTLERIGKTDFHGALV